MLKLTNNLLNKQILAGKSRREERTLKFVKQIEINLSICPKKAGGRNPIGLKWAGLSWPYLTNV
ncbi:MAG: hypothetical protein A2915_04340 [Candidatus Yanofskybacteria bacterium RIFCSPLOWO2_01_FULL_41_34]|uniref:Uncharacterized protein n=1 Tax=Candidatus Yanofskybacteria bacterium RIFCSPHIGHO2_01_FULL_41_26 TaxID=1802661 RepID=A0A1F8EBX4_9BACT|nr:MAG: hypothetical protein A2649_03440 [Candidatus Yanofskybacteria bacterium RIFCSPHIGHO2_01_FULL_41_26]OGN21633.1 MAG: hypothetical protein A2915_04340 [Candidatus Yanofskybacteria bacterium RIFCSPLOWO2_01_FULL_41_34]